MSVTLHYRTPRLRCHYRTGRIVDALAHLWGRRPGGTRQHILRIGREYPQVCAEAKRQGEYDWLREYTRPLEWVMSHGRPRPLEFHLITSSHSAFADVQAAALQYASNENAITGQFLARCLSILIHRLNQWLAALCAKWGILE